MPYREIDLAYIAGVIDSDGYIGLTRQRENRRKRNTVTFHPTVMVAQVEPEAIGLILSLFDGSLYKYKRNAKHKELIHLQFGRRDNVKELLENVLPYLRIKRIQALTVLEFISIREKTLYSQRDENSGRYLKTSRSSYSNREEELYHILRAANKAGVGQYAICN